MRVKHWITAVASTALVAGLGVVGAAPASAATINVAADCLNGGGETIVNIEVNPGDTIIISGDGTACTSYGTNLAGGTAQLYLSSWPNFPDETVYVSGTEPFEWVVRADAPNGPTPSIICVGVGDPCLNGVYYALIIGGSEPSAESAPIPPWVQAYGRFGADATCEAGWDPSWQEWAVPVTGGWVCTRSIPSLGS